MATVLLTWELGSGFGHVASLSTIATELATRGHKVVAALQDPQRGGDFFSSIGVECVQAPLPKRGTNRASPPIATFAELLRSVGFDSVDTIDSMLEGWQSVYETVRPDVVVMDHSPFALLAAGDRKFPTLQHGTGFYIPPDRSPLPVLRPWLVDSSKDAYARERPVLNAVNAALESRHRAPLNELADLYRSSAERWLATYEDLDHLGPRFQEKYYGITPPPAGGLKPQWPRGSGKRVFAYLQADASSIRVLETLAGSGCRVIARIAGLKSPPRLGPDTSLMIASESVDIGHAATECDVAVLSGGHGTVAAMLLAGKPVIIIPLQLEQFLLGTICHERKLGACVAPTDRDTILALLQSDEPYTEARNFAARYLQPPLKEGLNLLADRIEQLAKLH